jgi:3-oxoacyl-[acyl-carrier protein] reductase
MDLGLNGKVAMVAAASKGLGFGVAQALGREGAKLSICARTDADLEHAAARLQDQTGTSPLISALDVTDPTTIPLWIDRTVRDYGTVDLLVVNAGGPPALRFSEIDDAAWQSAFELTLMSSVRLIRGVLPHMPSGGAIVTITSTTISEPVEGLLLSSVMRAGVNGLVKSLADELAPRGIRINNLMPGRIDTDRVRHLEDVTAQRQNTTRDDVRAQAVQRIPLRRLGTIEEFGAAAAFLLSPLASYITGTSLRVDGGAMRSISG